VCLLVVDDARNVLAAAEHRVRPLLETVFLHDGVWHKEELVRARHDTNVHVGNVCESNDVWVSPDFVPKFSFVMRQKSEHPLARQLCEIDEFRPREEGTRVLFKERLRLRADNRRTMGGGVNAAILLSQQENRTL
jgi:hypothetical protein